MIKINLLESVTDQPQGVAAVEDRVASRAVQTLLLALTVFGLTIAAMGYDYVSSNMARAAAQKELDNEKRLNQQMLVIQKEQMELEKKTKEVQARIDAIKKLRESQQGPSAVLQEIKARFDAVPGFLLPIYSVGLIVIFLNSRDQRVGDIFAGTVVIRERTDEAPTFAETFSNPIADAAFRRVQKRTEFSANVVALSASEIEVVESFLRRRWDLTDRQRVWMAWRIALPLMYKLKPDYDLATFSYEGFLEEILHRYHARQRFLN